MTTLKQILDNTKNVIVNVPKTTNALSSFFVTVGDNTVRAGSMALLNLQLDTPVFVPTGKPDFSNCTQYVFDKDRHYAQTAMIACTQALIAKNQGIGARNCTTRR